MTHFMANKYTAFNRTLMYSSLPLPMSTYY